MKSKEHTTTFTTMRLTATFKAVSRLTVDKFNEYVSQKIIENSNAYFIAPNQTLHKIF